MATEAVKVLLCYGQQKKVVSLTDPDERSLHTAVSNAFNLESYVLQSLDPDFDEWVDLPDGFIPGQKERIKVLFAVDMENRTNTPIAASQSIGY